MKKVSGEDAYPLLWPAGHPRRKAHQRKRARFDTTFAMARAHLLDELRLMGARYVIISSDIPLRRDGLPYANTREPEDPGIAIYFSYADTQMALGCDKWRYTRHNLRALGKTIESLRGIARWGSTDMMRRAVHAFKMLPSDGSDWKSVLGDGINWGSMDQVEQLKIAKMRFRTLAATAHPDKGGNEHEMQRLNKAMGTAKKELT